MTPKPTFSGREKRFSGGKKTTCHTKYILEASDDGVEGKGRLEEEEDKRLCLISGKKPAH